MIVIGAGVIGVELVREHILLLLCYLLCVHVCGMCVCVCVCVCVCFAGITLLSADS